MKRNLLALFTALFMICGLAQAQVDSATGGVSGSVSPNNISTGDSTTVTLKGLTPGETYTVKLLGQGEDPYGTVSNEERTVTADDSGEASWSETINWGANTYATVIEFEDSSGGHPGSVNSGKLFVK